MQKNEIRTNNYLGKAPRVAPFLDKQTSTLSYVIQDPDSSSCAVIDTVLNFDYASGSTSHEGADAIIEYIEAHELQLEWLIETHVHADHLSAAPYIQEKLGGKIGISEHIAQIQQTFGLIFNEGEEFKRDGSQFDYLFSGSEIYTVGTLECQALHTPGHTPACMTHVMGDAVFVGDTLFMPDGGTARADFPGGDAGVLYDSIQTILTLPEATRLFMCHDYCPDGRELEYLSTVAEQKKSNIHVSSSVSRLAFVELREARDKTLDMPHLILPSLQVNMRAGYFPAAEIDNKVFLKIPINAFN